MVSDKLTKAIAALIGGVDYMYASLLMKLVRRPDATVPTMGVGVLKRELVYNPDFVAQLDPDMLKRVLMHECLHVIMDHIPRMRAMKALNETGNIAADLVVNRLCSMPDSVNGAQVATENNVRKQFPDLPVASTFEVYYTFLQKHADEMPEYESLDEHDTDDQSTPEIQSAMARRLVREALEDARRAGQEPSGMLRKLVQDMLTTKTDWRSALRQFPADVASCERLSNRFKRNRKYGYSFPGYAVERHIKIGVGVDLSGSITDDIKDQFCRELRMLEKQGCDIQVIFFDDRVIGVEPFSNSLLSKEWPAGGGTSFQPVFDVAANLKVDGLIMLTDGHNFDTIEKPVYPVLWGMLPDGRMDQPFGKIVILEASDGTTN